MMRKPPDTLFVPSHAIPAVHPKRTVNTIHDVGFIAWQQAYSRGAWQHLDWSTRLAVRQCSSIITISQFSKDEIVKIYHADPDKVNVVYLGYDREKYGLPASREASAETVANRFGIAGPYVLTIGRMDARKNQAVLVRAFDAIAKNHPSLRLVIVGPEGYQAHSVKECIEASPFRDRIVSLGWIDEDAKASLLQAASIFAFPSLYEGFGLPVIEAQACGLPVVAASAASIPEVAGEGALLFDPSDHEACAHAIEQLLNDPVLRQQLIGLGLENAKRFSWDECAQRTLRVLETP